MKQRSEKRASVATIGVDLGDRHSQFCVLEANGEVVETTKIPSTRAAFKKKFEGLAPCDVALETGTHANWVHDLLVDLGHTVAVANSRKLQAISANERKSDERDAELLARLARYDRTLLYPVAVRPKQLRQDMMVIRARAELVEVRTALVNSLRGLAKSAGHRLPSVSAASVHKLKVDASLEVALRPLMKSLESISAEIKKYDKLIEKLSVERYPQTSCLDQVKGVGPITALYFVLLIGDTGRFKNPRSVGAYTGLVPKRNQSGGRDPELRISKTGDRMGRTLLVQCAHYILGRFGPDSDLRRFGERLAARGGKNAKKRAVIATARKLGVLLFALLRSGKVYEPLRNSAKSSKAS